MYWFLEDSVIADDVSCIHDASSQSGSVKFVHEIKFAYWTKGVGATQNKERKNQIIHIIGDVSEGTRVRETTGRSARA